MPLAEMPGGKNNSFHFVEEAEDSLRTSGTRSLDPVFVLEL
jgi:hypothetical protein